MPIDGLDYVVRFVPLPLRIRGFTSMDIDGVANIYLNCCLSYAACCKAFWHEIRHVLNNDYGNDMDIMTVETA